MHHFWGRRDLEEFICLRIQWQCSWRLRQATLEGRGSGPVPWVEGGHGLQEARLREVPSVKVGRALRFDVRALERFVEQHTFKTIE
jgi:hypothetical protein